MSLIMASDTVSLVIPAAAGIIGALVGGAVTGWVTLRAERIRQEHERALEHERELTSRRAEVRHVLGAARSLQAQLHEAAAHISLYARDKRWWSDRLAARLEPSAMEEQTAVLGVLSQTEWRAVYGGLSALWNIEAQRQVGLRLQELDPVGATADPGGDAKGMSEVVEILQAAAAALDRAAAG